MGGEFRTRACQQAAVRGAIWNPGTHPGADDEPLEDAGAALAFASNLAILLSNLFLATTALEDGFGLLSSACIAMNFARADAALTVLPRRFGCSGATSEVLSPSSTPARAEVVLCLFSKLGLLIADVSSASLDDFRRSMGGGALIIYIMTDGLLTNVSALHNNYLHLDLDRDLPMRV